jgi:hypothetical protein
MAARTFSRKGDFVFRDVIDLYQRRNRAPIQFATAKVSGAVLKHGISPSFYAWTAGVAGVICCKLLAYKECAE